MFFVGKKIIIFICHIVFLYYLCGVFEAKKLFYLFNQKEMKKLVLLLAVVFSASLYSCGSSEKAEAANDSAAVVEEVVEEVVAVSDSVAADSVATDSVAAE